MNEENFKIVILRPPMIYGPNSKGNYPMLSKLAQKLPVFPKVKNVRSMLYIEHLTEFVRLMIENNERGVFWPQNREYSNTSDVVQMIAGAHDKKILLVPGCTWALQLMSHAVIRVNKAFGSITYVPELSAYKEEYCKYSLPETIRRTENPELYE